MCFMQIEDILNCWMLRILSLIKKKEVNQLSQMDYHSVRFIMLHLTGSSWV